MAASATSQRRTLSPPGAAGEDVRGGVEGGLVAAADAAQAQRQLGGARLGGHQVSSTFSAAARAWSASAGVSPGAAITSCSFQRGIQWVAFAVPAR